MLKRGDLIKNKRDGTFAILLEEREDKFGKYYMVFWAISTAHGHSFWSEEEIEKVTIDY